MLQDYGLIKHPLCAVVRKGKEHYFCKARYYDYLNKIMDHKEKYRNMIDYFTAIKSLFVLLTSTCGTYLPPLRAKFASKADAAIANTEMTAVTPAM